MNWEVRENQNEASLTHYGVKGMRWGVRKEYEPKGRKTFNKEIFKKTPTINDIKNMSIKNIEYRKLNNPEHINNKEIDTQYGKAIIDYRDRGNVILNRDLVKNVGEKNPNRYATKEEATEKFNNLPKYNGPKLTEEQERFKVNRDRANEMRRQNCFQCSMAYEMRMRGYDVQAKETKSGGWNFEVDKAFKIKDAFTIKFDKDTANPSDKGKMAEEAYKIIEKECLSYGEGARGCLGIQYYTTDSGHSMCWEVRNGEFKIIDSQGATSNGRNIFKHADTFDKSVTVQRLDNADVLPGVVDYIEPWAPTAEELEAQRIEKLKKKNATLRTKTMNNLEQEIKERKVDHDYQDFKKKIEEAREANRSTVEKLIRKVGKTIGDVSNNIISAGKNFITNLFNKK